MKTDNKNNVTKSNVRLIYISFIHFFAGLCLAIMSFAHYDNLLYFGINFSIGLGSLLIGYFLLYMAMEFDQIFSVDYQGKKTALLVRVAAVGVLGWLAVPTFVCVCLLSYAVFIVGGPIEATNILNLSGAIGVGITLISLSIIGYQYRVYTRRLKIVDSARAASVVNYTIDS